MKERDKSRLIDFGQLDPAVSGLLHESENRKAARHLTAAGRAKAARDHARNKLTIDLPQSLEDQLKTMAADLSVPVSGLVAYLVNAGLAAVTLEDIQGARIPSRSMRYEFKLPYGGEK